METSDNSPQPSSSLSISSPADSRARISLRPGKVPGSRELARVFGLSSPALLGWLDLDTCSLRMCQGSLFQEQCEEWSESWPDSGMWDAGAVYELPNSEPVICANGSSLWPTANTRDASSAARHTTETGIMHPGTTLTDAIRMWPTASAAIANDGETPESWERRRQENLAKGYNGNGQGTPLTIAATTWPTPNSHDQTGARGKGFELTDHHYKPHDLCSATDQWQTPGTDSFRSRGGNRKDEMGLDQEARHWRTPQFCSENSLRGSGQDPELRKAQGHNVTISDQACYWERSPPDPAIPDGPTSSATGQTSRRRLNPRFVEWLMGFPIGWTEL